MKEATFEDLAFPNHFGGGTVSLSPFQRSLHSMRLPASPSRAVPKGLPCDQGDISPWNPNDWLSANRSSKESDSIIEGKQLSKTHISSWAWRFFHEYPRFH